MLQPTRVPLSSTSESELTENQNQKSAAGVAACIVVREAGDELDRLLRHLARLTCRPDIIVVCQNSDDRGLAERLEQHELVDLHLQQPANPGFSGGVNACFAATQQPFVWILNPDVEPAVDYLERCLAVMDQHPKAGAVGGLLMRSNADSPEEIDSAGLVRQPWWRLVDRLSGSRHPEVLSSQERVLGLCGASLLVRRSAALEVAECGEIMDTDFWMYKEDQDFCLRLKRQGWESWLEPAARCQHQRGWKPGESSRRSMPRLLKQHSLKNRYLLLLKHLSLVRDLHRLPAILLFEVGLFLRLLVLEPRTCRGYFMALRLVPKMMKKRGRLNRCSRS